VLLQIIAAFTIAVYESGRRGLGDIRASLGYDFDLSCPNPLDAGKLSWLKKHYASIFNNSLLWKCCL
ncbi:MAG: hypothetical protein ACFFD9_10035, partial [Candidatus Thorarchaeota archaeon]